VIDTELFGLLREKHGKGFQQFVEEKVVALAGDIIYDNLGLETLPMLEALAKEIDVIVNIAATTNFYGRSSSHRRSSSTLYCTNHKLLIYDDGLQI
jgi:alcohol-forming fatty acyl-CoA reductase